MTNLIIVESIAEAQEKCAEIVEVFGSIKISLSLLYQWRDLKQEEGVIYTQELIPAQVLDVDELETGEWEVVWQLIEEQVRATAELNREKSALSFERVVRIRLFWIAFQDGGTRSRNDARGVDNTTGEVANNAADEEENNENRSGSEVELSRVLFVHLLYISSRIARKQSLPRNRKIAKRALEQFIATHNLESIGDAVANESNISELCANLSDISVLVYNSRCNIIKEHDVAHNSFRALLYWNGSRMGVIRNLQRFLNKRDVVGEFCAECRRIHVVGVGCDNRNVRLGEFKTPVNRDDQEICLTFYCDFEAICPLNREQIACCYSLITCVDDEKPSIKEVLVAKPSSIADDKEAEKVLVTSLFQEVEKKIHEFHGWNGEPTKIHTRCTWCVNTKFCILYRRVLANEDRPLYDRVCTHCLAQFSMYYEPIIFFHNFSKYDICFILRHLAHNYKLAIAGKSTELIYNITCKRLEAGIAFKIRDSLHYISGSIAAFSKQINNNEWNEFEGYLSYYYELFDGMKGEFAYEWLQKRCQLYEEFPNEDEIQRNRLSGQEVNLQELRRTCDRFGLQNVGEYLVKYCTVDVIILMFYFRRFRRSMFKEFKVDIAQFYSISSVSWYLATREKTLGIPTSTEDYLSLTANIRGGVSQPALRAAELGIDGVKHIKMLDVNALYSWCMTQELPFMHKETLMIFHHDDEVNWEDVLLNEIPANETWLCCVDLEYPWEIQTQKVHFQFPLAPHHYKNRLCTTFLEKEQYLVLDDLLKFYLQKGLKITKWYSIQKWIRKAIFKDFIVQNITARNQATDPTIRNARKVTNNSLYGKTCENVFRYKQFVIDKIQTEPEANGSINAHARNWLNFTVLDEEYAVAEIRKTEVLLSKPVQLGFAILEFAKLRMYQFWHLLVEVFGEAVNLLYTDTDSLLLAFTCTEDPFIIMRAHNELATFVDLPTGQDGVELPPSKELGLFSDELHHQRKIVGYIGLKAKSYILEFECGEVKKRTKGIRAAALYNKRPLNYRDFEDALLDSEEKRVEEYSLRKKNYRVRLVASDKKALSNHDAKHQYIAGNIIEAIPWGFDLSRITTNY